MKSYNPSEAHWAEVRRAAHMGRVANRAAAIPLLENLLVRHGKKEVLRGLREIRIGGDPLAFEDDFKKKTLQEIREAIRSVIHDLVEMNAEVPGLSTAIDIGLVGTAQFGPEQEGNYEARLNAPQVEWVRKGIEARYDRTRLVNTPLIKIDGVPDFPEKEAVLRSALGQLTREQVAYMMGQGRSPFLFQIKLVAPSSKVDLLKKLLNGQPSQMNTPTANQREAYVYPATERHLAGRPSPEKYEWKWEFYQGEQVMQVQKEDDVALKLKDRATRIRDKRPKGMRGTDRFSWTTRMADCLEEGKPLDVRFKDHARNILASEVCNFTVLDEEGELIEDRNHILVSGAFRPDSRCARLSGCSADFPDESACFRSSVEGSVEV